MPTRRERVWQRAGGACEYCQLPQSCTSLPHEIDHVQSKKHKGSSSLGNICLACAACNAHKGSDIAGYDSKTAQLTRLFNPRLDQWNDHFAWKGAILVGKTPIGRVTVELLRINLPNRFEHRRLLILNNQFPPRRKSRS